MNQSLNQFLIAILIFVGAATLAFAEEPIQEEISHCSTEIGKAEDFIQKQGADLVSAEIAKKAAQICQTEFTTRELHYFEILSGSCDSSFAGVSGTAGHAMHFICHMNAARFVLSLQMPSSRLLKRSQVIISSLPAGSAISDH